MNKGDVLSGQIVFVRGALRGVEAFVGVLTNTGVFIPITNVYAASVSEGLSVRELAGEYGPYQINPYVIRQLDYEFGVADASLDFRRVRLIEREDAARRMADKTDVHTTPLAVWLE